MSDPNRLPFEQWYASLPTFLASASAVISDPQGRVLVVKPNYRPHWNLPGGILEANEPPHAGCAREVEEELGLVRPPGRLLAVDWVPPIDIRKAALGFIFDGGILSDPTTIVLQASELDDFAFLPPKEAADLLTANTAGRLLGALRVKDGNEVAYLNDGVPVTLAAVDT
jgi:8-oxo-dGTP diphosphatase